MEDESGCMLTTEESEEDFKEVELGRGEAVEGKEKEKRSRKEKKEEKSSLKEG